MKLEFLDNINEYNDSLVRLYDFGTDEAKKLKSEIEQYILRNNTDFNLTKLDFITPQNCNLTFRISTKDSGLTTTNNYDFFCDLTLERYKEMILIIEPFTKSIKEGTCNWLYDLDVPIELLLSPDGNW